MQNTYRKHRLPRHERAARFFIIFRDCKSSDGLRDLLDRTTHFLMGFAMTSEILQLVTLNSTYEVDQEKKLVRRVKGVNPPTNYIGRDGDWQPYDEFIFPGVGQCAWFISDKLKGIRTSTVTEKRILKYREQSVYCNDSCT
jgi:hypothetical protein